MNNSLQDVLFHIPLSQLSFFDVLPNEPIYYEATIDYFPETWLERPTLVIQENLEEWNKLNNKESMIRLIQDPNLVGVVLCTPTSIPIQEDIHSLFLQCQIPIIQVHDSSLKSVFQQINEFLHSYRQMNIELEGLKEKGFHFVAQELSKALDSPFVYLDQSGQILWQTGKKQDLKEVNRWLNTHRKKNENESAFQENLIQISNSKHHTVVTHSFLFNWQKKMMDKFVGLTTLLFQTEETFKEQQDMFREHFMYDLLFHKFESKNVMIKQGKTWGWNFEKPHHLLLLNIEGTDEWMLMVNWLEELALYLESEVNSMEEKVIVLPFQDQIIILVEDEEERAMSDRKSFINKVVNQFVKSLSTQYPDLRYTFGIGKWYQDTINLNKSYQEAKLALQFGEEWLGDGSVVYDINDLGILRLFTNIHYEFLFDFSQEYLSKLIEEDQKNGTEYIKILQVYVQYQGKINESADALYIHPNTLRNRLKRIEEITGLQLQEVNDLINLSLAVRIYSFLNA